MPRRGEMRQVWNGRCLRASSTGDDAQQSLNLADRLGPEKMGEMWQPNLLVAAS